MQNYVPYYQAYGGYNYQPQYVPQMQQPAQCKGVTGRYVNTPDEIVANEVAMDGSFSLFPKNDLTEIYAKQWKADGTIQTVIYKPVTPEISPKKDDIREIMTSRFDDISERLEKLEKAYTKTKRREVVVDE